MEQSPKPDPGISNRGATAVGQKNDRLSTNGRGETEYLLRNEWKL